MKYLELDWGEASEGVLRASAVVGVLDPDDDRQAESCAGLPPPAVEDVLCSRLKNDSIAALSAHAPTLPIDPRSWAPRSSRT